MAKGSLVSVSIRYTESVICRLQVCSFQDGKPLDVVCNKIKERRGTSDSDCKIVEMENTNKESLEVECSGISGSEMRV